MIYRELGKTGMRLSAIGFGASSLGGVFHDFEEAKGIEAVGLPVTQRQAIANVGFTGRVVFIGYAKDDTGFTTRLFVQKELNIYGSRNACPEDFRAVIGYLRRGTCPYDRLITSVVKPEEAADAMRHWHENPGKVFRILVEF